MIRFWNALATSATLLVGGITLSSAQNEIDTRVRPLPRSISSWSSAPISRAFFGIHVHRSDRGTAWPDIPFGSWRLWDANVTWADLEPSRGAWDFHRLDRYVAMAQITHTEILLPLGMPPRWASARRDESSAYGPGRAAPPADPNAWRSYVETLARRYRGKVRYFEMWNEVNLTNFYTGSIEQLVELQRIAYSVLKGVDPKNQLVSASFTGNTVAEITKFSNYLRKGGADVADILSYHLYSPKVHPEAVVPLVAALRDRIRAAGAEGKPIWDTESGYAIHRAYNKGPASGMSPEWLQLDEQTGAAYWMIGYALKAQLGIDRVFHYAWDNEKMGFVGGVRNSNQGTLDALKGFVTWTIGRTPAGCTFYGTHTECRFKGPNRVGTSLVIWSRDAGRSIKLEASWAGAKGLHFCDREPRNFIVGADGLIMSTTCPIAVEHEGEAQST